MSHHSGLIVCRDVSMGFDVSNFVIQRLRLYCGNFSITARRKDNSRHPGAGRDP
jgi:hypothetical protein